MVEETFALMNNTETIDRTFKMILTYECYEEWSAEGSHH